METVYPEGLETVPKRFAIFRRNDRMLKQADVVVVYVTHRTGGSGHVCAKSHTARQTDHISYSGCLHI